MKVDFKDCEFGCFEPHREIEYKDKKYRAIDVELLTDDGALEHHTIAEYDLEHDILGPEGDIDYQGQILDDSISYYADNNDDVYYILENIVGEEID